MKAETKNKPTSWRGKIRIHPAADLFPMMSDAELKELADDIRENGLREHPILICSCNLETPAQRKVHNKNGCPDPVLIDGRNRLDAIERFIGWSEMFTNWEKLELVFEGNHIQHVWFVVEDQDEELWINVIVSKNLRRRHLTPEQKVRIAAEIRRLWQDKTVTPVMVSGDEGEPKTVTPVTVSVNKGGRGKEGLPSRSPKTPA
jgi:hypothetical protein